MSCSYADGLSEYHDKGKCGLPEIHDNADDIEDKINQLYTLIQDSHYVVVHTGAGISTAAGIPDFRGPNGVWTLEAQGRKPVSGLSFDEAIPTISHTILVEMQKRGLIHYIISQNIDGLHLRSGFPRSHLAELHGNMFIEQCDLCHRQFVRSTSVPTVGQKCIDKPCPIPKPSGHPCRGRLHDNILDWEDELPKDDLIQAEYHSRMADLSICLGTTLQIVPSSNLPLETKKNQGKLVICNLQSTKHDQHADLLIHTYIDDILIQLCKLFTLPILSYTVETDPIYKVKSGNYVYEWTLRKWQKAHQRRKLLSNEGKTGKKFKSKKEEST